MEAEINDLINRLASTRDKLSEFGEVKSALAGAKKEHEAVSSALDAKKDELERTKAGLSSAHMTNQRQHDEAIHDKSVELEDLSVKTAKARTALEEIETAVKSRQQQHDQIEASINSLKAKHFA